MGGKGARNNKHTWEAQSRQGEGKNSIGNGEAKELICTTHGHELRWEGSSGQRGIKVRKIWDNCNSIIYKIYIKKEVADERKIISAVYLREVRSIEMYRGSGFK